MSSETSGRWEIRVDAGGNYLLKDHRRRMAYQTGFGTDGRRRAEHMIEELEEKEREVMRDPE